MEGQITLVGDAFVKSSASLDNVTQSSTWTVPTKEEMARRKRSRIFGACLSGLQRCSALHRPAYFLTLTSAPGAGRIGADWDLLVKRVRRELRFPFHFVKVETSEGNGVIHALYHSAFDGWDLDAIHAYLSCLWQEIHGGSYIVWNSIVEESRKAAGYMTQYMAGQEGFVRMSQSDGWIFKGWRKKMCDLIKRHGFVNGLKRWRVILGFCGGATRCRRFVVRATSSGRNICRVGGQARLSRRSVCTLQSFRSAYKEMLERQSLLSHLDGTSGSMGVDTSGTSFWFA